jgi:molybdate transport system substrate-binding protein
VRRRPLAWLPAALVGMAVSLAACAAGTGPGSRPSPTASPDQSPGSSPAAIELTVLAAASLGEAMNRITAAWTGTHPDDRIVVSIGASSALLAQIELGAQADILLSADSRTVEALVAEGLADGKAVPFAGNALVVVTPPDDPAHVGSPSDLARAGLRIVAAGDEVPITRYAVQVVERLAALSGYPPDFAARYAANVVTREDNALAVAAKIRLGEGDAGFVYETDARAAGSALRVVPVPEGANVAAVYAGAVVAGSRAPGRARAFLDWLAGPVGQAILADLGFGAIP